MTKTAIILLCNEGIHIWAIPPLSPHPSDFRDYFLDYFLDNNSTHIPPLFNIPYPDGIVLHNDEISEWMIVASWYLGFCDSVCFDVSYMNSDRQRFKIIIKPDLSDVSLHAINMPESIPPRPETGSHPSITENTRIKIGPSAKLGIDNPKSVSTPTA